MWATFIGAVVLCGTAARGVVVGEEDGKVGSTLTAAFDFFAGPRVAISGDNMVAGGPTSSNFGSGVGFAATFHTTDNGVTWVEKTALVPSGVTEGAAVGTSVAISGSSIVVGATGAGSGGVAYFFRTLDGGLSWLEVDNEAPSALSSGASFGSAAAMDGSIAVVTAYWDDPGSLQDAGSAFVFKTSDSGASWSEQAQLLPSDGSAFDEFGQSVAISNFIIAVGSKRNAEEGAVYIFRSTDGGAVWTQSVILTASDRSESFKFGAGVAMSGSIVLVGSPGVASDAGALYAFTTETSGVSYVERQIMVPTGSVSNDKFGSAVSLDGSYAVVGAYSAVGNKGAVFAYSTADDGLSWTEDEKRTASDGESADFLGQGVAISDGLAIAGAAMATGNTANSGAVYYFRFATPGSGGDPVFVDFEGNKFLAGTRPNSDLLLLSIGTESLVIHTGPVMGREGGYFLQAVTLVHADKGMVTIEAIDGAHDVAISGSLTSAVAHGDGGLAAVSLGNGQGVVAVKAHVSNGFSFVNIKVLYASAELKATCTGMLCGVHQDLFL